MRKLWILSTPFLFAAWLGACERAPTTLDADLTGASQALERALPHTTVLDITGVRQGGEHLFDLSTHEVPPGWTTVRFHNEAPVDHFVILEKLPDESVTGIDPQQMFDDVQNRVVPAFQDLMDLIIDDGLSPFDAFLAVIGDFPDWYLAHGVTNMGGPGITVPGGSSEVTVNLEPGTYVIECYMKTSSGRFHVGLGMMEQLVVSGDPSGAPEPRGPTLEVTVGQDGFDAPETVRPGLHTVAVHMMEQAVHGNFVQSDVHLVRLEPGTDLSEFDTWMNWAEPEGLISPAPGTFIGGLQDIPEGTTGFITVLLTPGTYAWVGEVDVPSSKGMLSTFTVP